ncbi:MAG: glucose 1-dehydrogenase [Betaproteobacteria bacterium]|nr:glucose 1-dehydrogenase [Betaproteobacteria bacterium]
MRLKNKVALVTGAARGIGKAIAARFAAEGASVVVSDIDFDEATLTASALGGSGGVAAPCRLDVTQPGQVLAAIDFARQRFGRLDILVNNAGVTTRAPVLDMTLDAWERILRINLTGTMLCSQAAARAMIEAGGGRIINIASISGQRGGSGRAAYGASKAGVINLTSVMAIEFGRHNILVNAIAPGPTDVERAHSTSAQRQVTLSRMAIQRAVQPAEIASAALFLAGDDCGMITGHVLNVDGGFNTAGIVYADGA